MSKIFQKSRKAQFSGSRTVRYLQYALGEIILLVIGILIAVSINDWNEKRKQKKVLDNIWVALTRDLQNDTADVNRILARYEQLEDLFLRVMDGNMTRDEFAGCAPCPFLISSYRLISIEQKGYNLLKEYVNLSDSKNDTLVVQIVHFYSGILQNLERDQDLIIRDVIGNLHHWRDTYPWFVDRMRNRPNNQFLKYATESHEFRNKVAYYYVLIYENYLPVLKNFRRSSEIILEAIRERSRTDT